MIDTYNLLYLIFKFYKDQCPDFFDGCFYPIGDNSVITRSLNKKLKLAFCKTKLGIQSLFSVGPILGIVFLII